MVASMALPSSLHGAVGGVEPGDQLLDRWLLDGQIVDAMICRYSTDQSVCRRHPRIESEFHSATPASQHRSPLDVDVVDVFREIDDEAPLAERLGAHGRNGTVAQ